MANIIHGNYQDIKRETKEIRTLKQYVMISGLDYHDFWTFGAYADKRKAKLLAAKTAKEDMVFYMFDFLKGKIRCLSYKDGKGEQVTEKSFDPITKDNYKNKYFRSEGKKTLSKMDIYPVIEEIGRKDPGTLYELHVFSHAYWNGPILANSTKGADDIDMRIDDITSALWDKVVLGRAFHTTGIVKLWGCAFPRDINALYSAFRKHKNYKTSGTIPDDTVFDYPADHFWYKPNGAEAVDLTLFINNILGTMYLSRDKVSLTFLQIKKIVSYHYLFTFATAIAYWWRVKVQAALPATYAEITPDFHVSPQTKANVDMYVNHLGIKLGESNYGIFDYDTIQRLRKYHS